MNILVIGESCKDVFVYGSIDRICPEAPVPVFVPNRQTAHLGMAGNVTLNICAISGLKKDSDVECHLHSNLTKGHKTRFVDESSNQMLMRIDTDSYDENHVRNKFKNIKSIDFSIYDAVVVSDYNKGFLSYDDINYIADKTRESSKAKLFIDTKKHPRSSSDFSGFDFIKINEKEFIENGFSELYKDYEPQLIITKGSKGCSYKNKDYPCQATQVFDVSGAGDTFLAAFVYEYMKTLDVEKALDFSQKCCSIVVAKKGVCTV